jgi:NADH pyrophosphatase NudC (nudix superfamily)
MTYRYCPMCATPLVPARHGGIERQACPSCGFVHWDNPVPVVAAVVEYEGQILLARNVAWPQHFYALVTGFLEKGEIPHEGVQREVEEELGLAPHGAHFIGMYEFHRKNQLLIAYHVPATGTVRLNEELADYKLLPFERVRYWPAGTGYALRDFLRARGYEPQATELPNIRS